MPLTEEARQQYVQDGGVHCPYCGSADIEGSSLEVDGGSTIQKIYCLDCDREWTDVYQLTGIIEQG